MISQPNIDRANEGRKNKKFCRPASLDVEQARQEGEGHQE
jgi:hypothetical protein